jgi:hypothetical protein
MLGVAAANGAGLVAQPKSVFCNKGHSSAQHYVGSVKYIELAQKCSDPSQAQLREKAHRKWSPPRPNEEEGPI